MKNQQSIGVKTSLKRSLLGGAAATVLLIAGLFMVTSGSIMEIEGVINDYEKVSAINGSTVTVVDGSKFAVDDRVMIIQMKGANISENDDATYGDIINWGSAGVYEFNYIKSISGNDLELNHTPCKQYDPSHSVQLVLVPEYDSVRVNGSLRAKQWDGNTGGVLVLYATERVRLNANISVKGRGFEGGAFNGSARGRSLTYICDVSSGKGGRKGEGIVELSVNGCRGKLANGGGGGNDHNGGGGGGGNYGKGGKGGDGWKSNSPGNLSDLDKGGRGGFALENLYNDGTARLFMGGGGGGGHQNNGASYPGGDGGGIVVIVTPELILEKDAKIIASGLDAQDININDGSSGGGAGGSILIDIDTIIQPQRLTLLIDGGDGADITTADQHGPGGGGGGGLINTTEDLDPNVNVVLEGGNAGLFISTKSSHIYHNTTHGASDGNDGAILSNLIIQKCSNPPILDLNGPTNSGYDLDMTFFPNGPSQPIIGPEVEIVDSDDVNMYEAVVELINPVDGGDEYLEMSSQFSSQPSAIQAMVGPNGHRISFAGEATIAEYVAAFNEIRYNNESQSMDTQPRLFSVEVNDGGSNSNSTQITLSFSESNFPVEWLYFQAEPRGNAAMLSWGTATETNSHYFSVERSWDGNTFEAIGRVEAAGNSHAVKEYGFEDKEAFRAPEKEIIYRLRQVDIDGKFEYSSLVSLNMEGMETMGPKLQLPNPVSTHLPIHITHEQAVTGKISLLSISGQVIRQEATSGAHIQLDWDVSGLTPGIYVLNYRFGNQQLSRKIKVIR